MEPSAFTAQHGNLEPQKVAISFTKASSSNAIVDAFAEKYRQEGREEAAADYYPLIDAKDRKIAELEAQIALMQRRLSDTTSAALCCPSSRIYEYNAACFPIHNPGVIFDALIELAESKREGNKYIINTKTDWYMVWKVLHYFKLFLGNEYDFVDVVNDCVLKFFPDKKRRDALKVSATNFKGIDHSNPMKEVAVARWRQELEKLREIENQIQKPLLHNTPALDRGINIKVKLQHLLQARGVKSYNYED